MEIAQEDQEFRDYDWFCVDQDGHVGHFTTAGFKRLPTSVAASAEDLNTVTTYFMNLPSDGGYEVHPLLETEIPNENDRGERYLRDFVEMARRGLFSFDIKTYLKPEIAYFRVATPMHPITIEQLPESIRKILMRTVLRGQTLAAYARIPYNETLEM